MGSPAHKQDLQQFSFSHHQSSHPSFRADHRRQIRLAELEQVASIFPKGARVLEIGAGAGWQAKTLAQRGFDVVAIEIESSNYNTLREWDIITYDGVTIPLGSGSVDVVFSSNVLEHIPHIAEFQKEIQRVLRPNGISVHLMPTSTWRTYTTIGFYVHRILQIGKKVLGIKSPSTGKSNGDAHGGQRRGSSDYLSKFRRAMLPPTHGVRGNFITEALYFSASFWKSLFRETGWKIESVRGNRLLYSGFRIFGPRLSLPLRNRLSRLLGSSCKIYVLRK